MVSLRSFVFVILTAVVAIVVGGAGCSMLSNSTSDDPPSVKAEIAEVDSLEYPAEIASTDTLTVGFYGTVGPNGCYSFHRFDVDRAPGQLTITPVVRHTTADNVSCTMAIVPLNHTLTVAPPFPDGILEIEVPQPEGDDVRATVTVTDDSN